MSYTPIETEDDIRNAFDSITYQKGSAVLAMFERWIGEDTFRDGIRAYLGAHRFGTARSEDLLAALAQASGRDVATPFFSFLEQPGVPLVSANLSCGEGGRFVDATVEAGMEDKGLAFGFSVRAADFDVLCDDVEVKPQELAMAASLVDNLSMDFEPDKYHDDYREALLAVIESKLAGGQGIAPTVVAEGGDEGDGIVVDLMAALRESVERSKAERAGGAEAEKPAAAPKPAKKTAAKTRAAKKPAAKKTATKATAKKTSTKTAAAKDAEPARRRRTA